VKVRDICRSCWDYDLVGSDCRLVMRLLIGIRSFDWCQRRSSVGRIEECSEASRALQ
jgi:hypothetical protein